MHQASNGVQIDNKNQKAEFVTQFSASQLYHIMNRKILKTVMECDSFQRNKHINYVNKEATTYRKSSKVLEKVSILWNKAEHISY